MEAYPEYIQEREKMNNDERTDLNRFFTAMEERIKENATKPGWKNESFCYFILRMNTHLSSVVKKEVAREYPPVYTEEDFENFMNEAIDIANYAMMLYSNAKRGERTIK